MKPLKIFDLIVTLNVDKQSFFNLVDCDNSFSDHYKDSLWDKYQRKCGRSLVRFYRSLSADTSYHRHTKKSINIYFDSKVIMHLDESGVDIFKQVKQKNKTVNS